MKYPHLEKETWIVTAAPEKLLEALGMSSYKKMRLPLTETVINHKLLQRMNEKRKWSVSFRKGNQGILRS